MPEPHFILPGMKVCTLCKKAKGPDQFYHHPDTKDRRQSRCKECMKRTANQAYAEKLNPSKPTGTLFD